VLKRVTPCATRPVSADGAHEIVNEWCIDASPRSAAPTVFYDPRALAQGNPCVWPTLARSPIGRPRNNEVLYAGEVLKDVRAVISQDVDPIDKVGSGSTAFGGKADMT
jgi:hypothetical protein